MQGSLLCLLETFKCSVQLTLKHQQMSGCAAQQCLWARKSISAWSGSGVNDREDHGGVAGLIVRNSLP